MFFQQIQYSTAVNIGKRGCHFQKNEISVISKYGFCNETFRKDKSLTSWTLFSTYLSSKLDSLLIKTLERIRFSSNQNIGEGESNFDDKYVKKSVQLVKGSSFRNDLLQNWFDYKNLRFDNPVDEAQKLENLS